MPLPRARVVTLNAALGPLDYRVPDGMTVEPGSVVVAPLGPRQLVGVAWEAERLPSEEVGDNRLRPLAGLIDVPPIPAPLRRLCEWTSDYYLSPLAAVLRMVLPSSSALEGSRQLTEYRLTGARPDRLTPQRTQALDRLEGRQGTIRELAAHAEVSDAVLRGLVGSGALERIQVEADQPLTCPDPDFAPPTLSEDQQTAADSLVAAIGGGFDPVLLDGDYRLGQDRSLFRSGGRSRSQGPAGARAPARDRADPALPQALRRPLRLRARPRGTATCALRSAAAPGAGLPAARPRWWSVPARPCSCPTPTSA